MDPVTSHAFTGAHTAGVEPRDPVCLAHGATLRSRAGMYPDAVFLPVHHRPRKNGKNGGKTGEHGKNWGNTGKQGGETRENGGKMRKNGGGGNGETAGENKGRNWREMGKNGAENGAG